MLPGSGAGGMERTSREPLSTQESTCFFAPKSTGIASLAIQVAVLIVSALVVVFFFYQIGGMESLGLAGNATLLHTTRNTMTPIEKDVDEPPRSALAPIQDRTKELLMDANEDEEDMDNPRQLPPDLQNSTAEEGGQLDEEENPFDLSHRFNDTVIYINGMMELDVLELIRISTLVYIAMCCLWFISLFLLLLSIKFETIDLIMINAFFLTVTALYGVVHALFIIILIYFQLKTEFVWRTMAIVFGTAGLLILCAIGSGIALALLVGWYKYVVYMNDKNRCLCVAAIAGMFKKAKRGAPEQEYAMRETTRHVPYVHDDVPTRDFDHF